MQQQEQNMTANRLSILAATTLFLAASSLAHAGEISSNNGGSAVQFEIQVGTSDLQNAESARSDAQAKWDRTTASIARNIKG
jgi:hypothetical protein